MKVNFNLEWLTKAQVRNRGIAITAALDRGWGGQGCSPVALHKGKRPVTYFNPLNAELNPICHLLILLGDLTFMVPCIVNIFQYTSISNKMQRYTVYLYLETALHVSGGTSTHHQERIQLYLQHLVFVTPLLLSAAIVEELEPV
jgi:hypothetical protein